MKKNNLEAFKALISINRKEIFCPISKLRAVVSPLFVGDDLDLRTMAVSPDIYDEILSQLIYKHTTFINNEHGVVVPTTYNEFIENLSNIDRRILIWGIISCTYKELGDQKISCPKTNCDHYWSDNVKIDDTMREDSITVWDKEQNFNDYSFDIQIDINQENISKLVFETSIPTIAKNITIIKTLSPSEIKANREKFGDILTAKHELISMINKISLYNDNDKLLASIDDTDQLFELVETVISNPMSKEVRKKYMEHFEKYSLSFGKPQICPKCKHKFNFEIEPESELFGNFFS